MADEAVIEQQESSAPEAIADATPETPAPAPADPKAGALEKMQARIDELTWRLRDRERREQVEQPPEAPKPAPKAPKLEDVGYDEAKFQTLQTEYLRAEAERIVTERLSAAEQQRTFEQRSQTFKEREKAFAAKTPEYVEKVYNSATVPISTAMAEEITSSELGPQIAFYLAEHRDVAMELYQLPERQVAREIGKIEERLAAVPAPTPAVKKVSEAPPPPARIEADVSEVSKNPDDMPVEQWLKWRNKQVARGKG